MWRFHGLQKFTARQQRQQAKNVFIRTMSSAPGPKVPVDSLYVTSTDIIKKASPILLGLAHLLEQKFHSIGYFRPITPGISDHHLELMKSELDLDVELRELYGVSHKEAISAWVDGKEDDVIEKILDAFEKSKQKHDFVIIEGSPVAPHESALSWKINTDVAKAMGAPVLLVNDMLVASHEGTADLVDEIISRTILGKEQVEDAGLNYFGTISNRVRVEDSNDFSKLLKEKFTAESLPYLGFLPFDNLLSSRRLNEVAQKLGARQLFGQKVIANNVTVSDALVATSHLRDLFEFMKEREDGLLVITSADRSDVLLGLIASRIPGVLPSVSGIVLTNGNYPHNNTKEIIEGIAALDKTGLAIPTYVVEQDSFNTANAFSRISTDILPTSVRKIEQSKILFDNFIEKEMITGELQQGFEQHRSPKQFKHFIFNKARAVQRHIVLTEGEDIRILQAADEALRQGLAKITILGNPEEIRLHAKTLNLDLTGANIVKPSESDLLEKYAECYFEKRKHKGINREHARDQVMDETYFGTMMVEMGDADGMVSGACHTTANTIRPALQIIKTLPERPLVSSVFFMCLEDGVKLYGDCAVNTDPTAEELAQIAVTSAESAEAFGMEPKVALLSYATGDSNSGPIIDKVREATRIAQNLRPDIDIYGPIQYDAAVDMSIAEKKLKKIPSGAKVGGHANVLVFPDLNTGNNTYKAVQQSTQCIAMGPMLQGMRKPVNDLSRGATVKDIVTTIAITAIQAEQMYQKKQQ
jgi:phosphate acetyltransferase